MNVQNHLTFNRDADAVVGNAYICAAVGFVYLNDLQVARRCEFVASLVRIDLEEKCTEFRRDSETEIRLQ